MTGAWSASRVAAIAAAVVVLASGAAFGGYALGEGMGSDVDSAGPAAGWSVGAAGRSVGAAVREVQGFALAYNRARRRAYDRTFRDAYRATFRNALEEAGVRGSDQISVEASR